MFTPTLGEVHTAIRTNNRTQAAKMLQTLIQQKPSAEAWYLAAKLTNDRATKIHYLRTALLINKKHQPSRGYMRDLGVDVGGYHNLMAHNLLHVLYEQADKSPFLRHFPPAVQAFIGTGVGVLMLVLFGVLMSELIALRGPALSADGPSNAVVEFVSSADIVDYFSVSSLDIMFVEQIRDASVGKDIIQLDVRDVGNRSRVVEIFVYDNVQSILKDQNTLAVYDQATNVLASANVIVTYPLDLSDTSITHIVDFMDSI